MPRGSAACWVAENGTRWPVASTAPWRRGGRGQVPTDETRELVIDGHVVDPEQVASWQAADELDTDARHRLHHHDEANDAD
jgi:hypothetical protein